MFNLYHEYHTFLYVATGASSPAGHGSLAVILCKSDRRHLLKRLVYNVQRIDKVWTMSRYRLSGRIATASPGLLKGSKYSSLSFACHDVQGRTWISSMPVVRAHLHRFVDHFPQWPYCGSFGSLHGVILEVHICRLTSVPNPFRSDDHFVYTEQCRPRTSSNIRPAFDC